MLLVLLCLYACVLYNTYTNGMDLNFFPVRLMQT